MLGSLISQNLLNNAIFCYSCTAGDHLKVYLDLDRPEVNELTPWTGVLCGSQIPVLYSSGPVLIMELHSDHVPNNQSAGFRGMFRFIDKSKFFIDQIGFFFNLAFTVAEVVGARVFFLKSAQKIM